MKEADINIQLEAKKTKIAVVGLGWRHILAPINWEGNPNVPRNPYTLTERITNDQKEEINRQINQRTQNGGVVVIDYNCGNIDVLIGKTGTFEGALIALDSTQRRNLIHQRPPLIDAYRGSVSAELFTVFGRINAVRVSVDDIDTSYSLDEYDEISPTIFTVEKASRISLNLTEARLLVAPYDEGYIILKPSKKAA